ncbi:class I SAM-dependent methyltransferase [Haloferula sp.]|uniref:class I SAM-dependent methyltransferase n=1 Tax=Haloferula sp. TaxID=2497595 RepID=UPI00329EDE7A
MTKDQIDRISSRFPSRWFRNYLRSKLKSDPLYDAVYDELKGSNLPLLDIGCGLGVLAFYLREQGLTFPIRGLDYDKRKTDQATHVAQELNDDDCTFAEHDAREGIPEHLGNVTILDILQFFTPEELDHLVTTASDRVAPGGKLVIRSGLKDNSTRFKITVAGDLLAKATFWMKDAPTHYPTAEDFERILSPHGKVTISPLWGPTPFNNHLIVLEKQAAP